MEDDARLAGLVEVQAGAGHEVEEVVDTQPAEAVVLEVVGRHEVALLPGRGDEAALVGT